MSKAAKNGHQRKPDGTFGEGNPGRVPGSVNKTTGILKEAILLAAATAGDIIAEQKIANALKDDGEIITANGGLVGYLTEIALRTPQSFMPLLGKVLPLVLQASGNDAEREAIQRRADRFTAAMMALIERTDAGRVN